MNKNLTIILTLVFVLILASACSANDEEEKVNKGTEIASQSENGNSAKKEEDVSDTLPNMIYYNDTLYYVKESLDEFEGYHANQIADSFECLGYVDKIVAGNVRPSENFSSNCGGMVEETDDGRLAIYKINENSEEFLTTYNGDVLVWHTEVVHSKGIK